MSKKDLCVAVVGATGLVGRAFLAYMEKTGFVPRNLKLLASERSEGRELEFNGEKVNVQRLCEDSFRGVDLALFSAGAEVSELFAPVAVAEGAVVVDNSSRWRAEESVPLVVPEINLVDAVGHKLIANPNCSTVQAVLAVWALREHGISEIEYTTFQSVSGSGKRGLDALAAGLLGEDSKFYGTDISKTCLPVIGERDGNGFSSEELKMIFETRKILHLPDLPVSAVCVRVPVARGHGVSCVLRTKKPFSVEEAREALKKQAGIVLSDVPTCSEALGSDKVFVGRIKCDLFLPEKLSFFCVADNLLKGAAANAVQIARGIFE